MAGRWRFLLWFVAAVALLAVVVWIGRYPGRIVIDWFGYAVEMPAWLGALLVIAIFLLGALLARLLVYLARDFPLSPARRARRRAEKAREKLKAALAALAGEEWGAALALAEEAAGLADDPFAHWLAAEAAARLGDDERATRHWLALEGDAAFQMLAIRQRAENARAKRDWESLRALAGAAFAARPASPWAARRLFEAFVHLGAHAEAEALLDRLARLGVMDEDERARLRAGLATAAARRLLEEGGADAWPAARKELERALKIRPGFAPAAALLLRAAAAHEEPRAARRLARRLLKEAASGAVLAELARLVQREPPAERRAWLAELLAPQAEEPEARLLLAEAALAAGDREGARALLRDLRMPRPDARVMLLRSRLAQAAGDEEAARHWRQRAEAEGLRPAWVCRACGAPAAEWALVCPSCDAIGRLEWDYPPAVPAIAARHEQAPAALLPGIG